MLEIYDKAYGFLGDLEVAKHLSEFVVSYGFDYFGVDY